MVADVLKVNHVILTLFPSEAHDVQFLFTLCGGHISPILVAAERQNIRVIDVRHEASAVFAADAVSRLSGTVGVAAVTAGGLNSVVGFNRFSLNSNLKFSTFVIVLAFPQRASYLCLQVSQFR